MWKKALCLIFAFLLSINSFAAVVSDNDGSAFITKAEFEALKKDFNEQIDNYNASIDSKIDGAIASYLAAINMSRTETKKFPLIGNKKVLICNSRYIDDLKFGKIGIDWRLYIDLVCISGNGNNNAGKVVMTRTGNNGYEAFIVNNDANKFMYYGNALKIDTKVVFAIIRAIDAGLANRTTFTELKLRWGGNAYRAATEGTDDIVDSDGSVKWHPQFGHNRFFGFYSVNFNFGTNYWGGSSGIDGTQIDNNSSVEISGEKINWIMDASDASSTIWVKDPEVRPASLNRTNQTNYITTSVTYSYPSSAGITTTASANSVDVTADGTLTYLTYDGNVTWTNRGNYNTATSTSDTSKSWHELHLETNSKNPANIVNSNFDTQTLSDYSPYDFHGYITEGLPLGVFKEDSKIKFTLDTTSIGVGINFAINKKGFSTAEICDIGEVKGLKLKVDGVPQTAAVAGLTAGKHTIEIETEDKTGIFCKMSFHNSSTTNRKKRIIITWPESYELTSY